MSQQPFGTLQIVRLASLTEFVSVGNSKVSNSVTRSFTTPKLYNPIIFFVPMYSLFLIVLSTYFNLFNYRDI